MSTLWQVKENVESAAKSDINLLTKEELDLVDQVYEKYQELSAVGCTGCGYYIPCPEGVKIPQNFSLYNQVEIHNEYDSMTKKYNNMSDEEKSQACIECGQCEESCPQNLEVSDLLANVTEYFAS